MTRAKKSTGRNKRKTVIFKEAKGFRGARKNLLRTAKEALLKKYAYAFRDRKLKKRDFRGLWIIKINAACRQEGISYSKFISSLKKEGIEINRKLLADMAENDKASFNKLVELAKS